MTEKLTNQSKETHFIDFAIWEDQISSTTEESLPAGEASLEAARARREAYDASLESNERVADEPTRIVETQVNRIVDMSDFSPYSGSTQEELLKQATDGIRYGTPIGSEQLPQDTSTPKALEQDDAQPGAISTESDETAYSSRIANGASAVSEKLSSFAETYDKEGARGLARKALRRIGRTIASPVRNSASAFGTMVSSTASSGMDKVSSLVSATDGRKNTYHPHPSQLQETEHNQQEDGDVDETDELEAEDLEYYSKKSAKALDWIGEKVEGNGGTVRGFVAGKFYDKALKVDDREGTYASRAGDKVRRGVDKLDALSRENDGWLRDKIAEKYAEAKERRKNRVKKQHIRNIGRRVIAYHRAGKAAARNINNPKPQVRHEVSQSDFELVG